MPDANKIPFRRIKSKHPRLLYQNNFNKQRNFYSDIYLEYNIAMSPEHLGGNMWRLKKGESVTGQTTTSEYTITGPKILRIYEYPEHGLIRVQGPPEAPALELKGTDFAAHVKKIK